MADNPLTKLPLAGQLGVAIAVALVICGGFYFAYWQDATAEQAKITRNLEKLRKEIQKLEVTANQLPQLQRKVAELERELEGLKQILPAAKETPELMRRMQALASESRLSINEFTPGRTVRKEFQAQEQKAMTPQERRAAAAARRAAARGGGAGAAQAAKDYYEEWPINIDVDGSYHNLGMFFDRVGRLKRLVNIGDLKVKSQRDQTPSKTISVSCVATTYVYVEASQAGAGQ
jgi:type IV pilus assembly protein PilO